MHMHNGKKMYVSSCKHCKFSKDEFEIAKQYIFDNGTRFKLTTWKEWIEMIFAMDESEFEKFLSSHTSPYEDETNKYHLESLHCKEFATS